MLVLSGGAPKAVPQLFDIEECHKAFKSPLRIEYQESDPAVTVKQSDVELLAKRFSELTLSLSQQVKEIQTLKRKQKKLKRKNKQLQAHVELTGVSDGMINEFERFLKSLCNSALVKLPSNPAVKDIMGKINLTKLQSQNDILVERLISALKEAEQKRKEPGALMSSFSTISDVFFTAAIQFYAPALASMAVEAAFDQGVEQFMPEAFHTFCQSQNPGILGYATTIPAKHHAMNYAFNFVGDHEAFTLGISYALAKGTNKCASMAVNGCRSLADTAYLHFWQGKENNPLLQLLQSMKFQQQLQKQAPRSSVFEDVTVEEEEKRAESKNTVRPG